MTVTTTKSRDVKQGDGTTTDFPTSFQFFREDELDVTLVRDDGSLIDQGLNSDYTVTGGSGSPGTVKMNSAPAADEQLIIARRTFRVQNLDLVANDFLPAEALEDVADRLVLIVQELGDVTARAPRFRPDFTGDPPLISDPDAGKLLTWDANGNLVNTDIGEIDTSAVTVTTFGENLVGQAGPGGARQLLDLDDHTLNSVDASQLGGQLPSYYTNITARLGYTPADVSGDTFTGAVVVQATAGGTFVTASPSTSLAGNNQAITLGHTNSGLATVAADDGGGVGSGSLVLAGATLEHDNGTTKQRVLTEDDLPGWRVVDSGSVPNSQSFDVALPAGYRKLRLTIFEAAIDVTGSPRARFAVAGGSLITGSNAYSWTVFSAQGSGGNTSGNTEDNIVLFNGAQDLPHSGTVVNFEMEVENVENTNQFARLYSRATFEDQQTPSQAALNYALGFPNGNTDAVDTLRLYADDPSNSGNWTGGTWVLEGFKV